MTYRQSSCTGWIVEAAPAISDAAKGVSRVGVCLRGESASLYAQLRGVGVAYVVVECQWSAEAA